VVEADDPAGGLPWAARAFTSRDGHDCILAGRARGFSLGVIRDGLFHPYAPDTRGACGELRRVGLVLAVQTFTEPQLRSIAFGRVRPGLRAISVTGPGGTRRVIVGAAGAFLLVYRDRLGADDITIRPE
jgi:hypothetical protein